MIQSRLIQLLLAPLSLLYGLGVSLRNAFYRMGLLKSLKFSVPVISVGNLSVGGAGKTPHVEYLIRLLDGYIRVATLSRGYNRKTRGFIDVKHQHNAAIVGDEPLQYRRKFPNIGVFVAEDRAFAIPQIMMNHPDTQVVLLDDAFQHRTVKPGLNILLTEYARPYTRDFLLPSGRLREWRSSAERADIIIVSKCPANLSEASAARMRTEIAPLPHQRLYFSCYAYQSPYYAFNPRYRLRLDENLDVLLISAIANTDYLIEYLEAQTGAIRSLAFADHHYFTKEDISGLLRAFQQMDSPRKVIITTEKDATRLELHRDFLIQQRLPIFVLPAGVEILFNEGSRLDEQIRQYLLNFKV
ncbi:MAG: tetraacyldisaccharide 4'-kinase [Saprospiraceae bacterium]